MNCEFFCFFLDYLIKSEYTNIGNKINLQNMTVKKYHLWLIVNHLDEFRYVISDTEPIKVYVYDKEYDHSETRPKYHGSEDLKIDFYHNSDRKIYYWDFKMKDSYSGDSTSDMYYFTPRVIGTLVPLELINEEYLQMRFDSEPKLIVKDYYIETEPII